MKTKDFFTFQLKDWRKEKDPDLMQGGDANAASVSLASILGPAMTCEPTPRTSRLSASPKRSNPHKSFFNITMHRKQYS
jgi:hypothetical protein